MKKILAKKSYILLFLLLVVLMLIILVFLKMRVTSINTSTYQPEPAKKPVVSKEEYEKNISTILGDYEKIIDEAGIYATSTKQNISNSDPIYTEINNLREKVLATKAPSFEYKDLHMNLILSLSSIKDYLEMPLNKNKIACINYTEKVKKSRALFQE